MASLGKLVGLTDAEYADLEDRVDRFHLAWTPDGATEMEPFLPPPGARHRPTVLVEMIKTDMGRRVRAGLPVRVEAYLARFRGDIPPDATPVSLLAEEYRLRHHYADRPHLDEYRARFPALADSLAQHLRRSSVEPPPARNGTIGLDAGDSRPNLLGVTRSGGTLPEPPRKKPPAAETRTAVDPDEPSEVLPADLQYTLVRRLGAGTYGEVYEAVDSRGFRVAVKRIHRAVDHPASKGEIEALETMKGMRHVFLIHTQAYWVFRDRLVIVMELADGSLAGRVEHHKAHGRPGVPPEELLPIFEQAAAALDYLHSRNVSHRDVKPENLLLLNGYAKVADFGLARVHEHHMTVVGAEVGTPSYMAPEVWRRKVSLHSDQYSLAATYVAARLGRPLFPADTLPELCYQHIQSAPHLDPLPPAEQRVLLKALAKDPKDRYPSCGVFVRALRAAVHPTPRPKRGWAVWGVIAAALAIGVAIGVAGRFLPDPPPTTPAAAPEPERVEKPAAVWSHPGWTTPAGGKTTALPNGLVVPERLTRVVDDELLELVLILPKPDQPRDPPAFYMLRNKVTNRVFRAVWAALNAAPTSRLNHFRGLLEAKRADELLPGVWVKGAPSVDRAGQPLGSTGGQDGVPVVGVTLAEAILVAEHLGGQLPTYRQWLKAVGANGEGKHPGPAGPAERDGEVLSDRPLALGLTNGPWPVAKETVDVSVHRVHQLFSNGFEWADGKEESDRVDLFDQAHTDHRVPQTGQSWEMRVVPTFPRLSENTRMGMPWTDTTECIAFRIVVTPRP